jgi:hypothetical protein
MKVSLGAQTLAAFGTTSVNYRTTAGSSHTGTETMGAFALQYAGLKRSFHDLSRLQY